MVTGEPVVAVTINYITIIKDIRAVIHVNQTLLDRPEDLQEPKSNTL